MCWAIAGRSSAADAAEVLSRERGEDETTGVALLLALKAIFAAARRRRSSTGRASRTARRCTPKTSCPSCTTPTPAGRNTDAAEKPITDKGLARLLKGFRIKPGLVTIAGTEKRGYRVADFDDAFARYCPSSGCDFCGEGERADDPLLTVYDDEANALLHRSCWPSWAAAAGRS